MATHVGYGDGYQDAMSDVLVKFETEGPDAALQYVKDNLVKEHDD